jgi:la-related protein 1
VELIEHVRTQIEFWFSFENLQRDTYMRGLMDADAYVGLEALTRFNRLKRLGVTPHVILKAVQTSSKLSVLEPEGLRRAAVRPGSV